MMTKIYVGDRITVTLSGPAGILDQTKVDDVVEVSQVESSLLLVLAPKHHAEHTLMLFSARMWGSVTWKQTAA